jgi:hypothetical protein
LPPPCRYLVPEYQRLQQEQQRRAEEERRQQFRKQVCWVTIGLVLVAAATTTLSVLFGGKNRDNASPKVTMPFVPQCFNTSEELFQAVDLVILKQGNATVRTNVQQLYGYNIGAWCVSRIFNFSSLFSNRRNLGLQSFDADVR